MTCKLLFIASPPRAHHKACTAAGECSRVQWQYVVSLHSRLAHSRAPGTGPSPRPPTRSAGAKAGVGIKHTAQVGGVDVTGAGRRGGEAAAGGGESKGGGGDGVGVHLPGGNSRQAEKECESAGVLVVAVSAKRSGGAEHDWHVARRSSTAVRPNSAALPGRPSWAGRHGE